MTWHDEMLDASCLTLMHFSWYLLWRDRLRKVDLPGLAIPAFQQVSII